jgi:hypothetical protein
MRRASAASTGLPRMRRPSATVVSAHSTGARRQAAALPARHRRLQLQPGDALHIGRGRLAGPDRFERFDVLVGIGQQQLATHAPLLQQLLAARALGGQVDEVTHGGTDGWR